MRTKASERAVQAKLWAWERIIQRYLRYVLIRCLAYTNGKSTAGRMAFYALVTACLICEKGQRHGWREVGEVIDLMVDIVGNDAEADDAADQPVFALDGVMCAVARAVNSVDAPLREALVLAHVEALDADELGTALGVSAGQAPARLREAERALVQILRQMGAWDGLGDPEVHELLVRLAGCLDTAWAALVGGSALQYLVAWQRMDGQACLPWRVN